MDEMCLIIKDRKFCIVPEMACQFHLMDLFLFHVVHLYCCGSFIITTLFLKLFQDYEYASYNPVAYDLANHFCEMVANYHSEKPHFLDYRKYPGNCWVDLFTILHFICSYLTCRTQSSCKY